MSPRIKVFLNLVYDQGYISPDNKNDPLSSSPSVILRERNSFQNLIDIGRRRPSFKLVRVDLPTIQKVETEPRNRPENRIEMGKMIKASKLWMLLKCAWGKKPHPSQPTAEWARLVDSGEEGSEGRRNRRRVAPEGCFSVYVGAERRRFVVKTELANHPLFRMLLDEAESEYGFCSEGPLALPCDVDLFHRVLIHMNSDATAGKVAACPTCAFCPGDLNAYHLLTPSRFPVE